MLIPGSPEATRVMERALAKLVISFPLCAYTLSGESVRIEQANIKTPASTNGYNIYYSPDIVEYEKDAEFILCHEFLHIFDFHVQRRADREKNRWNAACDIWVNSECEAVLKTRVPEWLAYTAELMGRSSRTIREGFTVEQIYEELPEQQESSEDLAPGFGEPDDKKSWTEQFRKDVSRAHTTVQLTSRTPPTDAVEKRLYRILRNRIPWERLIPQDVISRLEAEDVSYAPPNLRYYPDLIIPRIQGYTGPEVLVGVDISASVPEEALNMFASSLTPVAARASRVHVVTFDQVVREIHVSDRPESLLRSIEFKQGGHGFTSVVPVFEYWDQHPSVVVAVILTDCYVQFPEKKYRNTIWVKTTKVTPPFGKSYSVDLHQ